MEKKDAHSAPPRTYPGIAPVEGDKGVDTQ